MGSLVLFAARAFTPWIVRGQSVTGVGQDPDVVQTTNWESGSGMTFYSGVLFILSI